MTTTAQPRVQILVDSLALLFEAIEQSNPGLLQPLSATNVTPGVPTPMPSPVSGGVNTSIVLTPIAGEGFTANF
jgi:hypothetical protein